MNNTRLGQILNVINNLKGKFSNDLRWFDSLDINFENGEYSLKNEKVPEEVIVGKLFYALVEYYSVKFKDINNYDSYSTSDKELCNSFIELFDEMFLAANGRRPISGDYAVYGMELPKIEKVKKERTSNQIFSSVKKLNERYDELVEKRNVAVSLFGEGSKQVQKIDGLIMDLVLKIQKKNDESVEAFNREKESLTPEQIHKRFVSKEPWESRFVQNGKWREDPSQATNLDHDVDDELLFSGSVFPIGVQNHEAIIADIIEDVERRHGIRINGENDPDYDIVYDGVDGPEETMSYSYSIHRKTKEQKREEKPELGEVLFSGSVSPVGVQDHDAIIADIIEDIRIKNPDIVITGEDDPNYDIVYDGVDGPEETMSYSYVVRAKSNVLDNNKTKVIAEKPIEVLRVEGKNIEAKEGEDEMSKELTDGRMESVSRQERKEVIDDMFRRLEGEVDKKLSDEKNDVSVKQAVKTNDPEPSSPIAPAQDEALKSEEAKRKEMVDFIAAAVDNGQEPKKKEEPQVKSDDSLKDDRNEKGENNMFSGSVSPVGVQDHDAIIKAIIEDIEAKHGVIINGENDPDYDIVFHGAEGPEETMSYSYTVTRKEKKEDKKQDDEYEIGEVLFSGSVSPVGIQDHDAIIAAIIEDIRAKNPDIVITGEDDPNYDIVYDGADGPEETFSFNYVVRAKRKKKDNGMNNENGNNGNGESGDNGNGNEDENEDEKKKENENGENGNGGSDDNGNGNEDENEDEKKKGNENGENGNGGSDDNSNGNEDENEDEKKKGNENGENGNGGSDDNGNGNEDENEDEKKKENEDENNPTKASDKLGDVVVKSTPWEWVKDHKKQILIVLGLAAMAVSLYLVVTSLMPALVAANNAQLLSNSLAVMSKNAAQWHTAGPAMKIALHKSSEALAANVSTLTGLSTTYADATGVWTIGTQTLPQAATAASKAAAIAASGVGKLKTASLVTGLGGIGTLGVGLLKGNSEKYKALVVKIGKFRTAKNDGKLTDAEVREIAEEILGEIESAGLSDSEKKSLQYKLKNALKEKKKLFGKAKVNNPIDEMMADEVAENAAENSAGKSK